MVYCGDSEVIACTRTSSSSSSDVVAELEVYELEVGNMFAIVMKWFAVMKYYP